MITTYFKVPTDMPLDLVGSAWFAHGLRRLSSTYTGKLCRIRRNSDNTESDIGYTLDNGLDIPTLTTFLGGATGYVVKLYDQTGNGYDAVQTTTANQPLLSLVEPNGLPAMVFTKTSAMTLQVTLTGTKPAAFSVLCSYLTTNVNLNNQAACGSAASGLNPTIWGIILQDYFGGNIQDGKIQTIAGNSSLNTYVDATTVAKPMINNVYQPVSIRFQSGILPPSMHVGGVAQTLAIGGTGSTSGGATGNFYIGKGYPGTELDGKILESIVYASYVSDTNMTKLETNTKSYYGI